MVSGRGSAYGECMEDPDFIDDEHPRDGSRSVTSLGRVSGPVHAAPSPESHGSSLATGGLGIHVMDGTPEGEEPTP